MAKEKMWRNDAWDDDVPGDDDREPTGLLKVQQFRIEEDELERLCGVITTDMPYDEIENRLNELNTVKIKLSNNLERIRVELEDDLKAQARGEEWFDKASRYERKIAWQESRIFGTIRHLERIIKLRRQKKFEGDEGMRNARREYVYFALNHNPDAEIRKMIMAFTQAAAEKITQDNIDAWGAVIAEVKYPNGPRGQEFPNIFPVADGVQLGDSLKVKETT